MKYTVIAPVTFGPGSVVGMTAEQAEARMHFIQPAKDKPGFFEVTGTVQFKVGETFIYTGDLPKVLVNAVDDEEKPTKSNNKTPKK